MIHVIVGVIHVNYFQRTCSWDKVTRVWSCDHFKISNTHLYSYHYNGQILNEKSEPNHQTIPAECWYSSLGNYILCLMVLWQSSVVFMWVWLHYFEGILWQRYNYTVQDENLFEYFNSFIFSFFPFLMYNLSLYQQSFCLSHVHVCRPLQRHGISYGVGILLVRVNNV